MTDVNGLNAILYIAARGDGVTSDGRYARYGVPGDILSEDGILVEGHHHVTPLCQHFGSCGGCRLQHVDEEMRRKFALDRIINAMKAQHIKTEDILGQVDETILIPPYSRRRATIHFARERGRIIVGFREEKSHMIVDMRECPMLAPEIFEMIAPLRRLMHKIAERKFYMKAHFTCLDQGLAVHLEPLEVSGLSMLEPLLQMAQGYALARLSITSYDSNMVEILYEPVPTTISFGTIAVRAPNAPFLQAARHGEEAIVKAIIDNLGDARKIADLFSGLGTLSLPLLQRDRRLYLYAAEGNSEAISALKQAVGVYGGKYITAHRDLFRNPLRSDEINQFDAIIMNPPRTGAKAQVMEIGGSSLSQLHYVSCNPNSFARDAHSLIKAGFRLKHIIPIAQFTWSTHIELVATFAR